MDGTQPTQLTNLDYGIFALQFSPDGQTIYFWCEVEGKGRLMRVSINGGDIVSVSDTDIERWAISPDGKRLAYSYLDTNTQKYLTRIRPLDEDKTEKVLDIAPDSYLQWSPDGQSLYFTVAADGEQNIWRQSVSEEKSQQFTDFDKEKVFYFVWSPDGKNLACIRLTRSFDAVMLSFDK